VKYDASVTRLRLLNYLAPAAAPHYQALAQVAAAAAGCEVEPLVPGNLEELEHELAQPALAFLCGLPYSRLRDRGFPVDPLAAPVPTGERYGGRPLYFSDLVVVPGVEDLSTARFAVNDLGSLSGYVLPRSELGSLLDAPVLTGSHHNSLAALRAGEVDAAPIDSTVLALEGLGELEVLRSFGPVTSPPAVLANGTPELAEALRAGLLGAAGEPLRLGRVERFAAVSDGDYNVVRRIDRTVRSMPNGPVAGADSASIPER